MNVKVLFTKDITEFIVSKKALILICVFVFFAFSGPLSAKLEPELLKAYSHKLGQGSIINVPEPVFTDAYKDTVNNYKQAGTIVLILLVCGTMIDEKKNGTAAMLVTKGLSRRSVVLSKLASRIVMFTMAYWIANLVCSLYTYIIFDRFFVKHLYVALLLYWIYGVFIICMSILFSILAGSFTGAFFMCFVAYFMISILNMVPQLNLYVPGKLNTLVLDIILEGRSLSGAIIPVCATLLLSIVSVYLSVRIFKEQEL